MNRYPKEHLDPDDDDGTMPDNVAALESCVIGRHIIKVEKDKDDYFVLTLDNKIRVRIANSNDCCAYTELREFLFHPELVNHAIMGIGTTEGYTRWHIYADAGDVLTLLVGWSAGNPFYYGYGFSFLVENIPVYKKEITTPFGEVTVLQHNESIEK